MYLVQQITTDPLQEQTLVLPDGSPVFLQIYFRPMQYGWFINELTWGSFTIKGLRITNSPNMLHQFKNQIPFGLACFSNANREPMLQEDFSTSASKLYLLDEDEVEEYAEFLENE